MQYTRENANTTQTSCVDVLLRPMVHAHVHGLQRFVCIWQYLAINGRACLVVKGEVLNVRIDHLARLSAKADYPQPCEVDLLCQLIYSYV